MKSLQFTVKTEHESFINKVNEFIRNHPAPPSVSLISTKDGFVYDLEFKEEYQMNEFNEKFSLVFAYLFIEE